MLFFRKMCIIEIFREIIDLKIIINLKKKKIKRELFGNGKFGENYGIVLISLRVESDEKTRSSLIGNNNIFLLI